MGRAGLRRRHERRGHCVMLIDNFGHDDILGPAPSKARDTVCVKMRKATCNTLALVFWGGGGVVQSWAARQAQRRLS